MVGQVLFFENRVLPGDFTPIQDRAVLLSGSTDGLLAHPICLNFSETNCDSAVPE
jgi:hypothetical protein